MDPQRQLLSTMDLFVHFPVKPTAGAGKVKRVGVVNGVSLGVHRGETLGLVGESGCGKTTLGRALVRLGHGVVSGRVFFEGEEISALGAGAFRPLRKEMQMIFQDPFGSLNPRLTVGQMLGEVLAVHRIAKGEAAGKRMFELLDIVGLNRESASRYPHEFSGGQRQRVGIARALAVNPKFIICDEPVSALDVSIQSQIINLLRDLQREMFLTYLFIAHDLSVVEHISDRVAVMYLGKIVEIASSRKLYSDPKHPYTQALFSAIPVPEPDSRRERILLKGDLPGPMHVPSGCGFHPRCPVVKPECRSLEPALRPLGENVSHQVSCLLYQ